MSGNANTATPGCKLAIHFLGRFMKIALAAVLALVAGVALAQGMQMRAIGPWQIVPLPQGTYSAFKIDTSTGQVFFCQVLAPGNGPVTNVRCVPEH